MWEVEYDLSRHLLIWLPLFIAFCAGLVWFIKTSLVNSWGGLMTGKPLPYYRGAPIFTDATEPITKPIIKSFGCLGIVIFAIWIPGFLLAMGLVFVSEGGFLRAHFTDQFDVETGYVTSVSLRPGELKTFRLNNRDFEVGSLPLLLGYSEMESAVFQVREGSCIHVQHVNRRITRLESCWNCREVCIHPED